MKTFMHVNEFPTSGYAVLSSAVLLCDRVTVWAPSFHILQNQQNLSQLGPEHFIELVEMGKIQVMARNWWYDDPDGKRHKATIETEPYIAWHKDYDEKIRNIAERRGDIDSDANKVRLVGKEKGEDWAKLQPKNGEAYQKAAIRLQKKALPKGFIEKAEKAKILGEDPVRKILRDAKNHEDAWVKSNAWFPLEPSDNPDATADIMARSPIQTPSNKAVDLKRVAELFKIASQLTVVRSGDDLVKRAKDGDSAEFARELSELILSDRPLLSCLRGSVADGAQEILTKSLGKAIRPKCLWDWTLTLGGLVSMVATVCTSNAYLGALAIGCWIGASAGEFPELMSWKPVKSYKGPFFPFFLNFGITRPTKKQIKQIGRELGNLLSKNINE